MPPVFIALFFFLVNVGTRDPADAGAVSTVTQGAFEFPLHAAHEREGLVTNESHKKSPVGNGNNVKGEKVGRKARVAPDVRMRQRGFKSEPQRAAGAEHARWRATDRTGLPGGWLRARSRGQITPQGPGLRVEEEPAA